MIYPIERIVPRFLLKDKNGYALAKAIERAFEIVAQAAQDGIDIIQNPEKMPEWRLDELARELNCLYDFSAPIENKRYWITNATRLFSIYGTPQAIVNFLEGLFAGVDVEEFWEYSSGDPFHFNVVLTGTEFDEARIAWVRNVVERVKNVRSVLDNVAVEQVAKILVSGDTDTFEQPAVYVSDDTYSGDMNTWLPLWAYLLTHSMSQAEMRDNSAVQAILQNFLALYNL